jgi:hypothetical protein
MDDWRHKRCGMDTIASDPTVQIRIWLLVGCIYIDIVDRQCTNKKDRIFFPHCS